MHAYITKTIKLSMYVELQIHGSSTLPFSNFPSLRALSLCLSFSHTLSQPHTRSFSHIHTHTNTHTHTLSLSLSFFLFHANTFILSFPKKETKNKKDTSYEKIFKRRPQHFNFHNLYIFSLKRKAGHYRLGGL